MLPCCLEDGFAVREVIDELAPVEPLLPAHDALEGSPGFLHLPAEAQGLR